MQPESQSASNALRRSWWVNLTGGGWQRPSAAEKQSIRLGEKLRQREHNQNGFDTIRLIAAALVLVSHSFPIATGYNYDEPLTVLTRGQATFGGLSVGAFFFISGLLISNSFEASRDLASFVRKRALRIMPALIVVCCLLVGVLGPLATDLPLSAYLHGAWRFMGQALFLPTAMNLPGVFDRHPASAVDGSLWSLRFEVACYVGAAALMALTRGKLLLALGFWVCSFIVSRLLNAGAEQQGVFFYVGTMASLYRFFGAGVVAYVMRDRVQLNRQAAWIALAVSVGAAATPFFMEAAATFGLYALLVFAYECPMWFRRITARGDLSYGTYLYAFPIQQLMYSVVGAKPWLITVTAMPLTLVAALASWLLVERPALRMKKKPQRAPDASGPTEQGTANLPTW